MLAPKFNYEQCVDLSVAATWDLDEVLPSDTHIDFSRAHLPDALAGVEGISCLSPEEKLALNHLRGHSYMNLFAFVEEYIIAQVVRHAEAEMFGDHEAIRALLRFGEEELKHQKMFRRYCALFRRDFGSPCDVLENAAEVANVILGNGAIAVMLVTLHLELMTQKHYVSCFRDEELTYPLFERMLRAHWQEEAQHTKIDVLELDRMLEEARPEDVELALDQYLGVLAAFDGLLSAQVEMDLRSLGLKCGRALSNGEVEEIRAAQLRSYRQDFLVMGMTNPLFTDTISKMSPAAVARVEERAAAYS